MQKSDYQEDHDLREETDRELSRHPMMLLLLAVGLFALGFAAFIFLADQLGGSDDTEAQSDSATTEVTPAETEGGESSGEETTDTTADDGEAETEAETSIPPDAPFVEATLNLDAGPNPGLFRLSGRVPDTETAEALMQAAELSYAPFVESDLEVDDSLEPAPWLAVSPRLIGLLPSVTDGTIRVVDGTIELEARSPNPQYLALLEGALNQLSGGMPVEVTKAEITDLTPPAFYVDVDDGEISLSGFVPSEQIREILVGGAALAYGQENVVSDLTIDEGTYISFWMYTMPGVFQLFQAFPKYQLQVVEGITSGTLQGGVNFAVDSTEITERAAQVLNIGVAVLSRDLSLFMTVEGHTDSDGPDEYNDRLSLARANSVIAYLTAAGVDESRLAALGAGEKEPIASNDTVEGKALNRRVEFLFGPAPG